MSRFSLSTVALLLATMVPLAAQQGPPARSGPTPTIDDRTSGLRKIDGYVPLYWDEKGGTMLLEVPWLDKEFLLSTGLSAGLGSKTRATASTRCSAVLRGITRSRCCDEGTCSP